MLALAGPGNPGIAGSDTVPVEHASFHQPVFANADVAVLRNAYPPGGDSGFHAHRRDLLTVIIQPAASTVQRPGQPAVANPRPRAGAVGFGTIGPDPLVHRVVNTDSVPFHIIAVEIRRDRPAGSSLSTRDAQPLYAPILDNARLRGRIQGSYTVKNSNNITKDIVYAENQPTQISFRGGYMVSEKDESVMEYSYDINGRVGSNSLTLANNPKFTRLNVPELRDTSGQWAEEPIKILASLHAISPNAKNFAPSLAISREEFAKAVAVVSDIVEEETTVRRSKKTQEQPLFTDTALDSEKYKYVKAVATKGIMGGVGEDRFEPKGELSKAQAATILINALGVEALAPNGAYSTGFKDDYSIPYWAKDSVYMARSLGLIDGTENGFFQPNKSLTRAEAASILNNYIHYLSYDLREDFRERIVNY